jgi:hypothetical protein
VSFAVNDVHGRERFFDANVGAGPAALIYKCGIYQVEASLGFVARHQFLERGGGELFSRRKSERMRMRLDSAHRVAGGGS